MKANALLGALALPLLLSACASAPKRAPAAPPPAPVVHHPQPAPPPVSVRPAKPDWRDEPASPGTWRWAREGQRSVARYGSQFALACDTSARQVAMELAAAASPNQPVTVTTTSSKSVLSGTQQGALFVVALQPADPLLDAMAFSRGRFMVETGTLSLFLPSWTEISRVVEDCR